MRRIYKYPIKPEFSLGLPMSAKVVHVALQDEGPMLWVQLDPQEPVVKRDFKVIATGNDIPDGCIHMGTWLQGAHVWHLFIHQLVPN